MIAFLSGQLRSREMQRDSSSVIVLDVGGVGYELSVNSRLAQELPPLDGTLVLSVYTHMREGAITLYGFADRSDRHLFELLLTVHGVGPGMALAILGALPESELIRAVASGDVKALTAVPGVGTKTAQRLILELAQRLDGVGALHPDDEHGATQSIDTREEGREALIALGYGVEEIRTVLRELPPGDSIEALLRAALTQLAPRS